MQSKATTVQQYLASLPEDRRLAIQAVRTAILKNLDKDYKEGMSYGMIGYFVPHSVFPAGYHCDPKQPLPFAGLASQKGHLSLYLMCLYNELGGKEGPTLVKWFKDAWAKSGKPKLDMGKACIRFKKVDDIPLDVIGEVISMVPAKVYIDRYERALAGAGTARAARKEAKQTSPKAAGTTKKILRKKSAKGK
jgi:hypothetical protein